MSDRPYRVGGVPEHFNLPWHQAMAAGLPEPGVEWFDMAGGTGQMMRALEAGELDIAVALTDGAIAAIAGGTPARIVRVYTSSPLQWGIHVAGGSALTEDRLGPEHRYAVSRTGSGSHLMAHVLADRLGYTVAEDRFVIVGDLDGARRALAAAEADVFLWDRFMTSPLVTAGEFARIGVQPTPWPAFMIAVHEQVLAERERSQLEAVLDDAAQAAVAFGEQATDAAVAQIVAAHALAAEEAAAWFEATRFAPPGPIDVNVVADAANRLVSLGVLPQPPDLSKICEPSGPVQGI